MKILTVLSALVIQCAVAKSWDNDSYSEETYSVYGWFSYLKRLSLIALTLSGVILYYVPESRPHARRICYVLVDVTANGLKSALSSRESEYMYEKIKSKCNRLQSHPLLLTKKRISQNVQNDDEDCGLLQRNYRKSKSFGDDVLHDAKEKKRTSGKQNKECKQSRHRFRNSTIKDVPAETRVDIGKPVYFYSDKMDDLQKYLKTNLSGLKRGNGSNVDNYAFLISGNPQQLAMLESKYGKDDVVILQEPCLKVECNECGTSTDRLSIKGDGLESFEYEGPTRDNDNHATESGMETYIKEVELNSIPENRVSRYSVSKSLYQSSQFQCRGEGCGPNALSVSSADLNTRDESNTVLKSSRSLMAPKTNVDIEESSENSYAIDCNNYRYEDRSGTNRKVDFRTGGVIYSQQKHEGVGHRIENTCKVRRRKPNSDDLLGEFGYKYCNKRETATDDENSQLGIFRKDNTDRKPKRENALAENDSDYSMTACDYEDFYTEPILKNRLKPALVRAVNWIFGGCPHAAKTVGKEENEEITDEWLL